MLQEKTGSEYLTEKELRTIVVKLDGRLLRSAKRKITVSEDGSAVITADDYTVTVLNTGDIIVVISGKYPENLEPDEHDLAVVFSDYEYHTILVVK